MSDSEILNLQNIKFYVFYVNSLPQFFTHSIYCDLQFHM